jgi:nucleoside-diphosphate-sugar epimerase
MKVLYIGGTGEISHACVMASLQLGQEITVFNRGLRAALPPDVEQIQGDLRDQSAYEALAGREFDTVCQFLVYTPDAVDRDVEFFRERCGQYLFVSTASAYRKPPRGEFITERTPLENPFWEYSRLKAACEDRLRQAVDLPVTIIRPSHTYRERVPSTVVTGDHLIWRLRQGKPVIVHDDGESLWTLTHATDFAAAFAGLIGEARAINEDFHITSSEAYTWNDILTCVARAIGCPIELRSVPTSVLIQHNPDWEGSLWGDKANSLQFDNTKVQKLLPDWRCVMPLAKGIEAAVQQLEHSGALSAPDPALDDLIDQIISQRI